MHDMRPNTGQSDEVSSTNAKATFLKELVVFFVGLMIGFYWHWFYAENPSSEVHVIIGLLVVIVCMGRYILLTRQ